MKRLVILLMVVVAAGGIGWQIYQKAFLSQKAPEGKRSGPVPVAVEIKPVGKGSIQDIRDFTGSLLARSQFVVAPKIAGRIKKLFFNIGDKVKQGQLVAVLDDEEYHQQVDQARAELEVVKANLEESRDALETARRDFERTVVLRQKKIASESELDAAESRYKSQESKLKVALAQVVQKEAALKGAEVRLSYTRIAVPPNEGGGERVVGERYVHEGAMLAANNPIISIFDIRSMIAAIHVIEQDYSKIQVGMTADVATDAYPGKTFAGKVVRMAPLLKEASREARVEIEIPNPEGLMKPGMFVRANIKFGQHDNATVVPKDALIKREEAIGVFSVDMAEKKARFIPVATGIINGRQVEILSPSLSGYVVTLGQHLLEDGAPVILPDEQQKGPVAAEEGKKGPAKKGKKGAKSKKQSSGEDKP
ncbi:MAG: efflux RND transporter periplasmic adaptor subunit [Desulfobacterales bacterium]|nr:efflux RND transporter periplasmic adaptor subunit [Desulfobacterales bacterium]